jgi:WD40 repeat protein
MPPEQERGEAVDQRADVFAIGAMLWELCALQKDPPAKTHDRHRMLRGAGIDQDLVAILDKAVDPDPERRYPHAGALAADLKAFKSGARITARSYSLPAMLAHWTRRHRRIALTAATAIALTAMGIALYVRNMAAERSRATRSEQIAERAQATAERAQAATARAQAATEASLDELTLKHAQLLLTTDPTATIDALATYHGADGDRANQIRAEAAGRGVAFLRAVPHSANVLWTAGTSNGAIVSLSTDGTISRTSLDGKSAVLARGVAQNGRSSYAPSRHLLAYACDPADLCLLDVLHGARIPVASLLRDAHIAGLSFSPDGALLAVMSREAVLRVLDVTDPARPSLRLTKPIRDGIDVGFLDENVIVAGTTAGVEFVRLNGDSERFSTPNSSNWGIQTREHELALATTTGQAFILKPFPLQVAARTELCHGPIVGLQFIPVRQGVAYACREGTVGIWNLTHGVVSPRAHLEGHVDLIKVSSTGDYIVAAAGNGTVSAIDLSTDLVTSYKGHESRLTAITPPTVDHSYLISADARGAVRAWPLPARFARVISNTNTPMHTAIFNNQSAIIVATTSPLLTTFSPSTGVRSVGPHEISNFFGCGSSPPGSSATVPIT